MFISNCSPLIFVINVILCLSNLTKHPKVSSMACMHLSRAPAPFPLGVTDVAMPSLFQFSAVDVAFAVDYSKDFGFEDGVVDNPPTKVAKLNYAPSTSPSPLLNEKHARNPRSTRDLCMDEPQIDVPTFANVPIVLVSISLDVPKAQTNAPKAKVPNYWPSQVFP